MPKNKIRKIQLFLSDRVMHLFFLRRLKEPIIAFPCLQDKNLLKNIFVHTQKPTWLKKKREKVSTGINLFITLTKY